ncbi:hypothetical protein [Geodermatophilus sp. SYSU D00766]
MDGSPDRSRGTTLGERLRRERERLFTGRARELAVFRAALSDDGAAVALLYLWGPGGIGKSALLDRYADTARRDGCRVLRLDGRDVPVSSEGVEAALRQALRLPDDADPVTALAAGPRPVLLVDTYERLAPLDPWIRESLLPRLPGDALVVVAGRDRPAAGWTADPGWHGLARVLPLDPLSADEARAFLTARGLPPERHDRVLAFGRGHPLALAMAAELDAVGDGWEAGAADVVARLVERFVSTVPSPDHRRALQVCAHAESTTEELLRVALDVDDAGALFTWLRGLSFVTQGRSGLHPHELVREVVDADLRWRDSRAHVELNWRVRRHVVGRILRSRGTELLRAVHELYYLQRSEPSFAGYLPCEDTDSVWEDRPRPGETDRLVALVERAEGPASAAVARFWLARRPDAFRVYRPAGRTEPVAVGAWLLLDTRDEEEVRADPVVAAAWAHTDRAGPVGPGERIGITRFLEDPDRHERPSPVTTLMSVRTSAGWVADGAAWTFCTFRDADLWAPHFAHVDHPRAVDAQVGGRRETLFAHDWRARSVRAWFNVMAQRLVGGSFDPAAATPLPAPLLDEAAFTAAVRAALRCLPRPEALAGNPLLGSRLVRGHEPAVDRLVDVVGEAVDALRREPDGDRLYRAVDRTYVRPAPTQERAAELLGVPFSTYRRHLARGVQRVAARLWQQELDARSAACRGRAGTGGQG